MSACVLILKIFSFFKHKYRYLYKEVNILFKTLKHTTLFYFATVIVLVLNPSLVGCFCFFFYLRKGVFSPTTAAAA